MRHAGHFKPAGQEPRRAMGGARPGGGRPTKEVALRKQIAAEVFRELVESDVIKFGRVYNRKALRDVRVLLNKADKLWPSEVAPFNRPLAVQIVIEGKEEVEVQGIVLGK